MRAATFGDETHRSRDGRPPESNRTDHLYQLRGTGSACAFQLILPDRTDPSLRRQTRRRGPTALCVVSFPTLELLGISPEKTQVPVIPVRSWSCGRRSIRRPHPALRVERVRIWRPLVPEDRSWSCGRRGIGAVAPLTQV